MNQPANTPPQVSEEFFHRVNDFIEMANRIERRLDTAHAQMVFVNAFARYSGHHYRSTAKADTPENRQQFADYMAGAVKELILVHLDDITRQSASAPASGDGDAPAA